MLLEENDYVVVIPHFNNYDKLLLAIDSVMIQSVLPSEIIVVDDCSTQSLNKLAELPAMNKLVRLLSTESNGGPGVARNVGIRSARAKFIAFLDADDVFLPDKIQSFLKDLSKYPNMFYWGHNYSVNRFQEKIDVSNSTVIREVAWPEVVLRNPAQTSCVIIRNFGLLFEDRKYCEDHQFFYRYIYISSTFLGGVSIFNSGYFTQLDRPQGSVGGLSGKIHRMRLGIIASLGQDFLLTFTFSAVALFSLLSQFPRHLLKVIK